MKLSVILVCMLLASCGDANLAEMKQAAPVKWKQQGFEVVDYEGFQWGLWLGGSFGGAKVWHRLKKIPDNGVTYSGFVQKWGDEIHVYGPIAADAIKP